MNDVYIAYIEKNFRAGTLQVIEQANEIIGEYSRQGFSLTLRQLYYQMVSRDLIPNKQKEYDRLGRIVNEARLAGLIAWTAIEDRTRSLRGLPHWNEPQDIIRSAISQFRIDKWETQPYRVEVWIEKDAVAGVIAGVCGRLDVPYFSCRGYTSASEMWLAGHYRLAGYIEQGQTPIILHLGDHDPSGIDMTRDITDRLALFSGSDVEIRRLALNRDQIDLYKPPPNPAKITDSRATQYIKLHGRSSWELDALSPSVMAGLIDAAVNQVLDEDLWAAAVERERAGRKWLKDTLGENS